MEKSKETTNSEIYDLNHIKCLLHTRHALSYVHIDYTWDNINVTIHSVTFVFLLFLVYLYLLKLVFFKEYHYKIKVRGQGVITNYAPWHSTWLEFPQKQNRRHLPTWMHTRNTNVYPMFEIMADLNAQCPSTGSYYT